MAIPPPLGLSFLATVLFPQVLLLLVAGDNSNSLPAEAATNILGCGGQLLLLAPCLSFMQGATPVPEETCCSNLLDVIRDQPDCLCPLLAGGALPLPLPLPPINRSLALQLPIACQLNITADAHTCTLLSQPPLSSPESQPLASVNASSPDHSPTLARNNASSAGTGEAARVSRSPPRMHSNTMRMNSGARLELGRTAPAFAIIALQFVGGTF